jgi:hypothetical protein
MDSSSLFNDVSGLSNLMEESRKALEKDAASSQPPKPTQPSIIKIGNSNSNSSNSNDNNNDNNKGIVDTKTIWNMEEIPSEDAVGSIPQDDRPCPRYEYSYKQEVGTEDTFLGMTNKTPSSAHCSHLIVKIHFPNTTMKDIDLDVTKNRIKAETKSLRLFTYLPVEVDSDKGSAKFDTKKSLLIVTLPIIHEFDML